MSDFFDKESFLGASVAEWLLLIASILLYLLSGEVSTRPAAVEAISARPLQPRGLQG